MHYLRRTVIGVLLLAALVLTACGSPAGNGENPVKAAGVLRVGTETPIGKMYGVNLGCLEDATEEELARAPITYVDGRNDRWQDAPAFLSHM